MTHAVVIQAESERPLLVDYGLSGLPVHTADRNSLPAVTDKNVYYFVHFRPSLTDPAVRVESFASVVLANPASITLIAAAPHKTAVAADSAKTYELLGAEYPVEYRVRRVAPATGVDTRCVSTLSAPSATRPASNGESSKFDYLVWSLDLRYRPALEQAFPRANSIDVSEASPELNGKRVAYVVYHTGRFHATNFVQQTFREMLTRCSPAQITLIALQPIVDRPDLMSPTSVVVDNKEYYIEPIFVQRRNPAKIWMESRFAKAAAKRLGIVD